MKSNIAGALVYAPFFGWVAAIVMLVVESNSEVRWHAVQSLVLWVAFFVLQALMTATLFLAVLVPMVTVAKVVLDLYLVAQVYQDKKVRLPLISDWTDKLVKKL